MSPQGGSEIPAGPDGKRSTRFLDACNRKPVDVTPVWMMRQAGRVLPAYRELRSRYGFLELTERPELMAEVTLMPFAELDVDAAIVFADIMLPLACMGVDFEIVEGVGPVVSEPIASRSQVDAMARIPVHEAVGSVPAAIEILRRELEGKVPLIGFAGAPFTLACYMIEGRPSREFTKPKALMFSDPSTWHELMGRLTETCIEYLTAQVEAGAQAVQLFDSWLGSLSPADAEEYVLQYTRQIFEALEPLGVPRVAFGTNTATMLEQLAATGCDMLSVDWRVPLDQAWRRIGHDRAIQGNLEPAVLLGPPELVRSRAHEILRLADGRPGHVFNLGHGVLPQTPLDNLKVLVEAVHTFTP